MKAVGAIAVPEKEKGFGALGGGGLFGLAVIVMVYLTLAPLVFLIYQTFLTPEYAGKTAQLTIGNYAKVFTDAATLRILLNSLQFALGSSAVALLIGSALAWVTERTNTPGRRWIYVINMVPLILPAILNTMAWVFLLSPKIGLLNLLLQRLFSSDKPLFDVYSMGGMVLIQGLHWSPFAFVTLAGAFRAMNPDLEEAATTCGAGVWRTFRSITLSINLPALLSLFLILFVRGLESFEVPAVIAIPAGIDVLTSRIYRAVVKDYPTDFGLAATYSVVLMLITVFGLYLYYRSTRQSSRFATVTGKGYRARLIELGNWRYATAAFYVAYVLFAIGFPFVMLVWVSFTPFSMALSWENLSRVTTSNYASVLYYPGVLSSFANSIILGLLAAAMTILLGLVSSWMYVKLKIRGGWILDSLGTLPLTFPGTLVGVALATVYLKIPVGIYGTIWILLIAYVTRFLPYGVRASNSSLLQIHSELEEVARVSGASLRETFRRVTLPLVWSGIVGTFVYVMIMTVREFSSAVLLYGPQSRVIAVQLYEMWQSAWFNQVAALGVLLVVFLSVLGFLMNRFQRSGHH